MRLGTSWPLQCALIALTLSACHSGGQSGTVCRPDPLTGSQMCQMSSNNNADAIVTTGVATAVYAATGCTVNGCELPDSCNQITKRCQPTRCDETKPCPVGYRCQPDSQTCR